MLKPGKKSKLLARKLWARLRAGIKEEVSIVAPTPTSMPTGLERLQQRQQAAKLELLRAYCRVADKLVG